MFTINIGLVKCVNLSCNCRKFKEMYAEQLKRKCVNL